MSLYLKIHKNNQGKIVAACDSDIIGRVLEDENTHMDLDKYRGFYVGERVKEEQLRSELLTFTSVNLVGKKAVEVAVAMKLVNKKDVMYINNIPYIQIYKI
ncbi:MAG: DUF424 family protein [Candidatus Micrarchaeota archaeon]